MKRKIFTLLAAFMVLATFQVNAQAGGVGAPFLINVQGWYGDSTQIATPGVGTGLDYIWANDGNWAPSTPNADFVPDVYPLPDGSVFLNGLNHSIGYLTLDNGSLAYRNRIGGGLFGNLDSYFTFETYTVGGSQTKQFYINNFAPDYSGIVPQRIIIDGHSRFEVVRFKDLGTPSSILQGSAEAVSHEDGGWLCVPGAQGWNGSGMELVVVDLRDNLLKVVNFTEYNNHRYDDILTTSLPINTGAPKIAPTDQNYYMAIWIKSTGVTGRWARTEDFSDLRDFIQIRSSLDGKFFEVKGTDGKMYNKFHVALRGLHAWWGSDSTNFAFVPGFDPSYTHNATVDSALTLDKNGNIQLFSLVSPENGSNLVTVPKKKNAITYQWSFDRSGYGNQFHLRPPVDTTTSRDYNDGFVPTIPQDTATQMFGIWLNPDGTMKLYPYKVYDYKFGESEANQPNDLEYRLNNSIKWNAPVIPSNYKTHLTDPVQDYANYAYTNSYLTDLNGIRINQFVVGPSSIDVLTVFSRQEYYVRDATRYNMLSSRRYFYLETKIPGRDGKPLVVDMVRVPVLDDNDLPVMGVNGEPLVYKKLVLTDREKNRFEYGRPIGGYPDTTYYNVPYDSLNMSAAWSVREVYNTDYDKTILPAQKAVIGYIFMNELGDTLQYAQNISGNLWGDYSIDPGFAPIDSTITNALMRNYPFATTPLATDTVNSNVWKTMGFTDDTKDGYFFMMNLNQVPLRDTTGTVKKVKELRPLWDVRIDTIRNLSGLAGGDPFNNIAYDTTYFRSGTNSGLLTPTRKLGDEVRKSWFYEPYSFQGLKLNGIDSVVHRNVGAFRYLDSIPAYSMYGENGLFLDPTTNLVPNPNDPDVYDLYDVWRTTFGLELRLAPIHVNADTTLAPHDSIINNTYEWERYRVDSLWTYFNKRPGNYAIREALGYDDIMKVSGYDYSQALKVFMGLPNDDGRVMGIVRVDSAQIANHSGYDAVSADWNSDPLLYSTANPTHSYKWYHIYLADTVTQDTLWMVYDELWPNETGDLRYGFSFSNEIQDRWGAGKFRFYQPLVGDKEQDYFLIQTQVPQFRYHGNPAVPGTTTLTNYPGPGEMKFAQLIKGSKEITVTSNPTVATRWEFIPYSVFNCRIDYIDNEFLVESKMYGAPLVAKYYYADPDSNRYVYPYKNYYMGERVIKDAETGILSNKEEERVQFSLVPAKLIKSRQYGTGKYFGSIDGYYGMNPADTSAHFKFNNRDRDVQLYYVRRIERTENGSDTTYMTVTDRNLYSSSMPGQKDPSPAGDIVEFRPLKYYADQNIGGNIYRNDSTLLQMFAVYGKLGLDEDRVNADGSWNERCISSAKDDFNFGQFIFVPGAGYIYDYEQGKAIAFNRNHMIGDGDIDNEYRIGRDGDRDGVPHLVIVPSKQEDTRGVPASEFIFEYNMFGGDFACPNFVEDANGIGYASDGEADYKRDYADPSAQWSLTKDSLQIFINQKSDYRYKYYSIDPVADVKRTQLPVTRTELLNDYFLYLVKEDLTEYDGYARTFHAVKKFQRDASGNYDMGGTFETYDNDVNYISIIEITNKAIGNVDIIKGAGADRQYNGDSTIDYFYKFSDEEIYGAQWKILESILVDRYIWSRPNDNAIAGERIAYVQQKSAQHPGEYLQLKKSNVDIIALCNGTVIHSIPYYTIMYTHTDGTHYYLRLKQDGTVDFVTLPQSQEEVLDDYENNPDFRPDLKFCFPYKMTEYNKIAYQTNVEGDEYYGYKRVFLQSRVGTMAPKTGLVKVEGESADVKASIKDDRYIDFVGKSEEDLDATTFVFGGDFNADEVWIRLNGIETDPLRLGWLRQVGTGADKFVIRTKDADKGVVFGELRDKNDIKSLYANEGGIDAAKLTFIFQDSALLKGYDPKRIWYYNIKNDQGKFLTSAGFDPATVPADADLVWMGEGYAYFTDSLASDPEYTQLFGLKYIKPTDLSQADPYEFWVVAGVDSMGANTKQSEYYYLSSKNYRLTFRYGGGTAKQETEETALRFLYGTVDDNGDFTDIEDVNTTDLVVYGVENGVKVYNATEGAAIKVFDLSGRMLKSVKATGAAQFINVNKGIVIVDVDGVTFKAAVK